MLGVSRGSQAILTRRRGEKYGRIEAESWRHGGERGSENADRIHTPLLLLHGSADTNVLPGEIDQLFTALKLLGRDVEYVPIEGQDHRILDHDQRIGWNDTILVNFARYLRERPAWWEARYPQ